MKVNKYYKLSSFFISKVIIALFFCFLLTPAYSLTGPTLIIDKADRDASRATVWNFGPMLKYKHVDGFNHFKGDMGLFGGHMAVGRVRDPMFGVMHVFGDIKNENYKLDMKITGLTVERSVRNDPRVKWRLTAGWGEYNYIRRWSGQSEKKSTFGFIEPQIVGLLPMNKNIALEFGLGWTIADDTSLEVDGVAINAELLFGKF